MLFMRFPIDAVFLGEPAPDGARRVVAVRPSFGRGRGRLVGARRRRLPGAGGGRGAELGTAVGDTVRLEALDAVG